MRYINTRGLVSSRDWDLRANRAHQEVEEAYCEIEEACCKVEEGQCEAEESTRKLSDVINNHQQIWKDIKPKLASLSFDKCWYCETRQDRSSMAVDHFRPKAGVKECPNHQGYWWLAFDLQNYRYSCEYCNSRRTDPKTNITGGKGTYFPLLTEETRADSPTDDITQEEICLLDPTNPTDPGLLAFDDYGEAGPSAAALSENAKLRVKKSIELYNLNLSVTVERRSVLCRDVKDTFNSAVQYFIDNNQEALGRALSDLRLWISEKAEYAAAAKCYLLGLRTNNDTRDLVMQLVLQPL